MQRHLYPDPEAMERLGGSGRTTLWRLIKDGHLARVNIGRRAFVTAESLDAYVASLTEEGQTA